MKFQEQVPLRDLKYKKRNILLVNDIPKKY